MASEKTSISASIFDELLVTVESIGVEKTIKRLQEARADKLIMEDFGIEFILNTVSQVTSVSRERILQGKDRNGEERKMAVSLCVYYIKVECQYSYSDMKKIFDKNESGLYRYFQKVSLLPSKPKTEFDKKLSGYAKQVENLIAIGKLKK